MRHFTVLIHVSIILILAFPISCQTSHNWQLGYAVPSKIHALGYGTLNNAAKQETVGEAHRFYPGTLLTSDPIYQTPEVVTHAHYLAANADEAIFCEEGYVSENDLKKCHAILEKKTLQLIGSMLSGMYIPNFEPTVFANIYKSFFTSAIWNEMNAYEQEHGSSPLGRWQLIKPTSGLDKEATEYNITPIGNNRYQVSSPNSTNTFCLEIAYQGKRMIPVITGINNPNENINIHYTPNDIPAGKTDRLMSLSYGDKELFMHEMCKAIHHEYKNQPIVTLDDLNSFSRKTESIKLAFVHHLYRDIANDNAQRNTLVHKYSHSLCWKLKDILLWMAKSDRSNPHAAAQLFWPADLTTTHGADYQITYLGNDWYQITLPDSSSLQLKVVLYGPKLTPAIMGIKNPYVDTYYCPKRFANN